MNKKILISGGIAAFVIGAIAGLYYYTKKSINKIAAAIDDTFDIEDNNTIQCQIDLTKTNKNGSSCAKDAFIPKEEEEEKNQKETIKVHNFKFDDCYKHIKPISIQEEIEKAIKEKCDECPCKKSETDKMYNSTFQYLFDDKFYKDYINTLNAFYGDDGK